jgi:hypothetical protein
MTRALRRTPPLLSFLVGWLVGPLTPLEIWRTSVEEEEVIQRDSEDSWKNACSATCIVSKEELAFLKARIMNLSPAVLRQLKRDITAEKRREAATAAKEPGMDEGPNRLGGGRQSGPAGEESALPQKTVSKRKANELDSFSSGGSMEPAARRQAPGPLSGVGSAPLHAKAVGPKIALRLGAVSTGERAAKSSRQLSYAEVGASYSGLVAGNPVKGSSVRVDTLALSTKNGASKEGKGGRSVKSFRKTAPRPSPPEGRRTPR